MAYQRESEQECTKPRKLDRELNSCKQPALTLSFLRDPAHAVGHATLIKHRLQSPSTVFSPLPNAAPQASSDARRSQKTVSVWFCTELPASGTQATRQAAAVYGDCTEKTGPVPSSSCSSNKPQAFTLPFSFWSAWWISVRCQDPFSRLRRCSLSLNSPHGSDSTSCCSRAPY